MTHREIREHMDDQHLKIMADMPWNDLPLIASLLGWSEERVRARMRKFELKLAHRPEGSRATARTKSSRTRKRA